MVANLLNLKVNNAQSVKANLLIQFDGEEKTVVFVKIFIFFGGGGQHQLAGSICLKSCQLYSGRR